MPQTSPSTNTPRAERRSRQWWFEQVQAWHCSALSKVEFCAAHGLNVASLYRWASRFGQQGDQPLSVSKPSASRSAFVQALVQPDCTVPAPAAYALTIGDVTVQFESGLAPAALTEWVQALRALPC